MITPELKQLVLTEACKLREHATEEERAQLNFNILDTDSPILCVYGQMTGDCFSLRATELLTLCTVPFSRKTSLFEEPEHKVFIHNERYYLFSPIEYYICQDGAKNETLINFIRGDQTELNVDEL